MSFLASDFLIKSTEKLRILLAASSTEIAVETRVVSPPNTPQVVAILETVCEKPQEPAVIGVSTSTSIFEERLVRLSDVPAGRKSILKDSPASLDLVSSEEDIAKFSLEALKKLAKASSLEHPKNANKAAIVSLLVDVYRKHLRTSCQEQEGSEQASALR